jgi:hypothetical protein
MTRLWAIVTVLERTAEAAAVAGAFSFFGFWVLAIFAAGDAIPWFLTLAWHGVTIALLVIAFVGVQLGRADGRADRLAWTGVALVLLGLLTVMEALMAGFVLFGVALVVGGLRERLPGVLLTLGGVIFLVTLGASAPFWSEGDPKPTGGSLLAYTAAIALISSGTAVMGPVAHRSWTARLGAPRVTPPQS